MITIRKRNIGGWIILFIVFYSSLLYGTKQMLGIPSFLNYIGDIAIYILFILSIVEIVHHKSNCNSEKMKLIMWCTAFFMYACIAYIWKYQSFFYFFNGFRNTFRFYIFFVGCILFLTAKDVQYYFKLFDWLLLVNVILCTYQFFILGKKMDYLGGIFGTLPGCNGYMNIFLLIVIVRSALLYLNKTEKLSLCFTKLIGVVYIASLAELKAVFFEIILLVGLAILFTRFTWRKFIIIMGGTVFLCVGVIVLFKIFPEWAPQFSVEGIYNIVASDKGYTGEGDINRLTVISTVDKLFFRTTSEKLFGFGLGNCDYASLEIFITPFYKRFFRLHHTWLSSASIYLELGLVGLVFFFGFFVNIFIQAKKRINKNDYMCLYTKLMAIFGIIVGIYNNSLRTDSAYMLYLVLAFVFVNGKLQEK